MKYVTLTFDDGRIDNYAYVSPILNKYDLPATIFCVTGFVDGTWRKTDGGWKSVTAPVSVEQLQEMSYDRWEIGLHGDKHITEYEDLKNAITKMKSWGFSTTLLPFSIPDSKNETDELQKIIESDIIDHISFIRKGRAIKAKSLKNIVLYVLYTKCKQQWAYNRFNIPSVNLKANFDRYNVSSVVVRHEDSPQMMLKFLDSVPDESWTVFMLHSILPESDKYYNADCWTWSDVKFDTFVKGLKNNCEIKVIPMSEMRGWL